MTKISKQIKLAALIEYTTGKDSKLGTAKKFGINPMYFKMMVAAFQTHGESVLFDPPKITSKFRIEVAQWAIITNASYTEVAAKFGYTGTLQIQQWKEIYRNHGSNGLMSISKGRKPKMKSNDKNKKQIKLTPDQNRIKQLEAENLELRIKNEASKLFASMKQQTKK